MALLSSKFKNNMRLQNAAKNMPPLTLGEVGQAVQLLQEVLVFLKYPLPKSTKKEGVMDGVYGLETKTAVQAFQRKNALEDDGSAGTFTLGKLDSYLLAGPIPIPSTPPSPGPLKHEVRIHLRATLTARTNGGEQVSQAQKVFAAYGIGLKIVSRAQLNLPPAAAKLLEIVDINETSKLSEDQKLLLSFGGPVSPKDIMAYFVYRLNTPDIGLISGVNSSAENRPAVIVASNASGPNVLAHEIAHVLLGKSYWPFHSNDPNNLMFKKAPSIALPILTEEQLYEMRRSSLLTKLT